MPWARAEGSVGRTAHGGKGTLHTMEGCEVLWWRRLVGLRGGERASERPHMQPEMFTHPPGLSPDPPVASATIRPKVRHVMRHT